MTWFCPIVQWFSHPIVEQKVDGSKAWFKKGTDFVGSGVGETFEWCLDAVEEEEEEVEKEQQVKVASVVRDVEEED